MKKYQKYIFLFFFVLVGNIGCITSNALSKKKKEQQTNKLSHRCEQGEANACFLFASQLADTMDMTYDKVIHRSLKKACSRHHSMACSFLAIWTLQQGGLCKDMKKYLLKSCHHGDGLGCLLLLYLKEKKFDFPSKNLTCFSSLPDHVANKIVCKNQSLLESLRTMHRFFVDKLKKSFPKRFVLQERYLHSLKEGTFCTASYERDRILFLFTKINKRVFSTWLKGPILQFIKEKHHAFWKDIKGISMEEKEFFSVVPSKVKVCGLVQKPFNDFEYQIRE